MKEGDNAGLIRKTEGEHRLDERVFVLEHVGLDGRKLVRGEQSSPQHHGPE